MFFDPEDGEVYGHTHMPTKNGGDSVSVADTTSLISWGEATDKLLVGKNIVDEYEKPGGNLPVKKMAFYPANMKSSLQTDGMTILSATTFLKM